MVPADCVGDHDPVAHRQNSAEVDRRHADVIGAAAAIAAIEAWRQANDRP